MVDLDGRVGAFGWMLMIGLRVGRSGSEDIALCKDATRCIASFVEPFVIEANPPTTGITGIYPARYAIVLVPSQHPSGPISNDFTRHGKSSGPDR